LVDAARPPASRQRLAFIKLAFIKLAFIRLAFIKLAFISNDVIATLRPPTDIAADRRARCVNARLREDVREKLAPIE